MSRDPFTMAGPTCYSISGGRTSAYMMWRALQANGGPNNPDMHFAFANTGKEKEATLVFVRECERQWGVKIHWLEFVSRAAAGFAIVDFETASRKGEPFDRLIAAKHRLPNPVERACTEELKVKTIDRFLASRDIDADMAVGVRADEAHRIPKLRARGRWLPLVDAGVTKAEVHAFWRAQSFDLGLSYEDGDGNCDLCFLKTEWQVMNQIRRAPQAVVWWDAHEKARGATFHKDRPSYGAMAAFVRDQRDMFDPTATGLPCFCGD